MRMPHKTHTVILISPLLEQRDEGCVREVVGAAEGPRRAHDLVRVRVRVRARARVRVRVRARARVRVRVRVRPRS